MFRDVVTTLLEVAGLAAICGGAGIAVGQWSMPAGLVVGGLGLIGSSVVIERPWQGRPEPAEAAGDLDAVL